MQAKPIIEPTLGKNCRCPVWDAASYSPLRACVSRSLWVLIVIILSLLHLGCGGGIDKPLFPSFTTLSGTVHGGQHGVAGATIQLYSVGTTGYGSSATAMLTTTVTTNAAGSFTITGDYTCPSSSTQVYIVATGGNPGLPPGNNNASLAMMAGLGPCGNLTSSTFIFIDEVTTVASVYALAPFMSAGGGTKLGASATNAQGLANAFATVNNLVNTANGTAPGLSLPTGATAPTTELNALADILAPCVNSNGLTGECNTLFTDTTPGGGSRPANTIDAMLNIAQNPASNVSALFSLVTGTAPFQPTLAAAPNDWTVDIKYIGGGLNAPRGIAVDGSGNIWVANAGANSISKFSSTGAAISGAGGYTGGGLSGPRFITLDLLGNVWVSDVTSNALSKFSSAGTAISGAGGYTGGGLNQPLGVAVNAAGVVWAANVSTVSAFLSTGTAQAGSPYAPTGGGTQNYYVIAIDASGNVWTTNNLATGNVEKWSSTGAVIANYAAGPQNASFGIAIDSAGHAWISNSGNKSITKLNSTGTLVATYTGGGLNTPQGLAVDGLGNVWTANNGNSSVTELNNSGVALSPTTGFTGGGMSGSYYLAVDGSGNVWVTNNTAGSNSITEIVGAAAPVVTPLALAVKNSVLGTRP